jgi:hypothetical protein
MAGMPWEDYAADPPQVAAASPQPVQQVESDDTPPWADYAQPDQPTQPVQPNRTFGQWVTDVGGSVGRGAYNLFDAAAGLGDIATGGAVTPWLAGQGLDSQKARAVLDAEMSPQARAQQQEVADAKGFGPTVKAIAQNPAYAAGQVIESIPTMVAGGVAGKGVALGARALGAGTGFAGLLGAGTGEGLATAGQQASQTVQQTGDLTPGQTGLALLSGGLTGLLGAAGARVGRAFGVADIDAQMAGANGVDVAKGLVNRVLAGSGIESLEELSQSAQQQVLTNLATDRPALEGVDKQAAMGGVLGGVMGGAAGLRHPTAPAPDTLVQEQQAQQQQGQAMPTPALQPATSPIAPQTPAVDLGQFVADRDTARQVAAQPAQPMPFAGSQDINPLLDRLNLQGDQRAQTMDLLKPVELNVEDARRGVLPNTERDRLATLIGLQGSDALVFNRKIGEALNAEQTVALTTHVQDNLKDVLDLQSRIASGNATDIDRATFIQSLGQLRSTFADLAGARAEAGRALSAYKRQAMDYRQAQAVLEAVGGTQGADDAAKSLGEAIRTGGISNAAKLINNPETKLQRLFGYYYRSALLSGIGTHVANAIGNTGMLVKEVFDRTGAAAVGSAKRFATGGKAGETVWGEPLSLMMGNVKGTLDAVRAAGTTFTTGESPLLGVAKQEQGGGVRPAAGTLENAFSVPYRLLGAEDAVFSTLAYSGELRAIARQHALAEKKLGQLPPGKKLSARIEEIVANPSPQMIERAGDQARYQTFNSPAGVLAQGMMSAKAKLPFLHVIAPFVRTPANIVKVAWHSGPTALASTSFWHDVKAGGAVQERAIGRALVGSAFMAGVGALATAGIVTGSGGTMDKEELQAKKAAGWRPYSLRVNGNYYSYNRFDPFASMMAVAADFAVADYKHKDAPKIAAGILGSFVTNFLDKSFFQGVSNFSNFLSDPSRNGEWYLKSIGGTLAQPFTLVANAASAGDPYQRQTDSVLDAVMNRVPGLRQSLATQIDPYGQPVRNDRGGLSSMVVPVAVSPASTDPVRRLGADLGWIPSKQQDHFSLGGKRFDLTPEQIHERDELVGKLLHNGAQRAMSAPGWKSLDDDQKRALLDSIVKKARAAVKIALIPYMAHGNRAALDKLHSALGGPRK